MKRRRTVNRATRRRYQLLATKLVMIGYQFKPYDGRYPSYRGHWTGIAPNGGTGVFTTFNFAIDAAIKHAEETYGAKITSGDTGADRRADERLRKRGRERSSAGGVSEGAASEP